MVELDNATKLFSVITAANCLLPSVTKGATNDEWLTWAISELSPVLQSVYGGTKGSKPDPNIKTRLNGLLKKLDVQLNKGKFLSGGVCMMQHSYRFQLFPEVGVMFLVQIYVRNKHKRFLFRQFLKKRSRIQLNN